MIWKGFRFGLLLQIAVGPICLFIFQTAAGSGFWIAEIGVLGVTIVDVFYILAAILGIGFILTKYKKTKGIIHNIGAAVLLVFGLSNIISFWGITLIPSLDFLSKQTTQSVFWKTLVLTLSNPLTILFWAGVFSGKIGEENMKQKDLYIFGIGAILSTFVFLTIISAVGTVLTLFLAPIILRMLNLSVGLVLIAFGFRIIIKARKTV